MSAAVAADLALTLINRPRAPHASDLFEDTDASRAVIREVLRFLRENLQQ